MGAQRQRCGQRPRDKQRYHMWMGQRERAVTAGDGTQLARPVRVSCIDR